MATTLSQLAYNLLNMARGGVLSDDENISYRQVQFWVRNTRAILIRQDIQKGRTISGNIIQMLPCVDVITVDASTCPCNVPVGCSILRTKNRIPKPIETDMRDLITKVSSIEMNARSFSIINMFRAPWTGYNKYAKSNPKAFYFDGYIWIINSNPIEKITIYGVFEDPMELANYTDCSNQPCFSDDSAYPISSWMIPIMEKMIIEGNFKIILNATTDNEGDAKSETETTVNKQ